jgi:hypothetical protein
MKTSYRPEFDQALIDHMTKGLSFESFAGVIGTCRATIYNWCDKNHGSHQPSFLDAKKVATEACRLFWEEQGIKGMWAGKAFNSTPWIFNMRNRFGWSDKVHHEVEAKGSIKLSYNLEEDSE